MKILVRNLARMSTEEDLKALFTPFGTVQYCKLVMDGVSGVSKGFAFVEMPKGGEAKLAVKRLNNIEFDGVHIRVKRAENKPATPPRPAPDADTPQAPPESGE